VRGQRPACLGVQGTRPSAAGGEQLRRRTRQQRRRLAAAAAERQPGHQVTWAGAGQASLIFHAREPRRSAGSSRPAAASHQTWCLFVVLLCRKID